MSRIKIGGISYKVTDNMGYQSGFYVKEIATQDGLRIVTRPAGGLWDWAKPTVIVGRRCEEQVE